MPLAREHNHAAQRRSVSAADRCASHIHYAILHNHNAYSGELNRGGTVTTGWASVAMRCKALLAVHSLLMVKQSLVFNTLYNNSGPILTKFLRIRFGDFRPTLLADTIIAGQKLMRLLGKGITAASTSASKL